MMDVKLLTDMLHPGVPVLEKVIRPILVYAFLVIGLRLAGKRELAQLNSLDLVVLLTLSNTVQNAIIGDDNSVTGGIIGASTLLALNYWVVRLLYGHARLDRLVDGESDVLIEDGQVRYERLRGELINLRELETAAHKQGFASLDDVQRAVLDPGGAISFIAKKPTVDDTRHRELMARMDDIARELGALRTARQ